MPKLTRRNLLAKSGTGMAAAGILSMSPGLLNVHGSAKTSSVVKTAAAVNTRPSGNVTPSVVYIRDVAKGEVVLMVGARQIVRTDRALVDAISRAATENA